MIVSGVAFVLSIPIIALSHGYSPLFLGRLLQGISGGLIGIVVPLYLAECLSASNRGKGTGVFQWLLTLGIVAAALIGIYYSYRVEAVVRASSAAAIFAFKDQAWRRIFWVSLPPGILFVLGSFFVTESPRWLFRKGKHEAARAALLRSRSAEQAEIEMREMQAIADAGQPSSGGQKASGSLLQRKYVVPFVLACVILFCNTATGINSIIGYNTGILLQSGLSDLAAHWGYVIFTIVNFVMTMIGMTLVDKAGRKTLFIVGTGGIIVSLVSVGLMFLKSEKVSVDRSSAVQAMVKPDETLSLKFTPDLAQQLLAAGAQAGPSVNSQRAALVVVYSCGDFTSATNFVRSDDQSAPLTISRSDCVPQNSLRCLPQESVCRLRCRARGAAQDRSRHDQRRAGEASWLDGCARTLSVYGVLCCRAGRLRVAGADGVDADAHSLERHEHRAGDQSTGVNDAGGNLSAVRQQVRIFDDVLCLCRIYRDLYSDDRDLSS